MGHNLADRIEASTDALQADRAERRLILFALRRYAADAGGWSDVGQAAHELADAIEGD